MCSVSAPAAAFKQLFEVWRQRLHRQRPCIIDQGLTDRRPSLGRTKAVRWLASDFPLHLL